jgi:hypothetical protein
MLSSNRPLWQAEVEIRRHHARLRSETDTKDLKAGEPLVATHKPDADRQWDSEGHQQPPASACGTPDDPDGLFADAVIDEAMALELATDLGAGGGLDLAYGFRSWPLSILTLMGWGLRSFAAQELQSRVGQLTAVTGPAKPCS